MRPLPCAEGPDRRRFQMPPSRFLAVVSSVALLLAACAREEVPTAPSAAGAPRGLLPDVSTIPRMYFMLQSSDLRESDWPSHYLDYKLFVCNPAMTATDIAEVRQAVPAAMLLAYFDLQSLPLYEYSEPYYQALTATVDSSLCMINLDDQCMLKLEDWRNPEIILNQTSADLLVAFHRDVTMLQDWDGIYLDQCTRRWPFRKRTLLEGLDVTYDIDQDGLADTMDDLDAQYETWRPYFTSELRRVLRRNVSHPDDPVGGTPSRPSSIGAPGVMLVGNVARDIIDPALNGITFEAIGVAIQLDYAMLWAQAQQAVARPPKLLGAWARLQQSIVPSMTFAELMGGYYGTLETDDEDIGFPDIP